MSANSTMFPKEISKTSTKAEMPRKDMPGSTSAAEMPRGSMVERHGQDTMAPGRMDPPTSRATPSVARSKAAPDKAVSPMGRGRGHVFARPGQEVALGSGAAVPA
jgi:hypothetical protein